MDFYESVKRFEMLLEASQEFNSAKTSRNQVPGLHSFLIKKGMIPEGSLILDYGGGKWDKAKEKVESEVPNSTLLVYDPFNRDAKHNKEVTKQIRQNSGADITLLANVLNVIKEPEVRQDVLKKMKRLGGKNSNYYISIHNAERNDEYDEQDGWVGQPTKDGWQNAQPTKFYLPEVQKVFPNAELKYNIIKVER